MQVFPQEGDWLWVPLAFMLLQSNLERSKILCFKTYTFKIPAKEVSVVCINTEQATGPEIPRRRHLPVGVVVSDWVRLVL